jgi:hypothetical protein
VNSRTAYLLAALFCLPPAFAWNNGQSGNASTNQPSECNDVPYATHDWIPDHALALLPMEEQAWLLPHKRLFLLGTEAPDNREIPTECGAPHNGYDDRSSGHSVEWNSSFSDFATTANGQKKDRAARRAQEEYNKGVIAFQQGKPADAAFFLGAMAHYIGDVSQYGHSVPNETHHSDYEGWVARQTASFDDGVFESFIVLESLVRRTPYTAVRRISRATAKGDGDILSAAMMDSLYPQRETHQGYRNSVGASLNLGVNELADVLHTFFLNVVDEES